MEEGKDKASDLTSKADDKATGLYFFVHKFIWVLINCTFHRVKRIGEGNCRRRNEASQGYCIRY